MDVSVVVPAYNRAGLLPATLRSIIDQTLAPREVIVVDDGSTDETEAAVRAFGSPVRYIRIANSGPGIARNRGAAIATGEHLAFCDSDDLWTRDHLSAHAALHRAAGPIPMSFSNFRLIRGEVWSAGAKFDTASPGFWDGWTAVEGGRWFSSPIYDRIIRFQPIFPSALVIRRERFEQLGGYEPIFSKTASEDLEFILRCVEAGPIGAVIAPTVGIRKHAGGFSNDALAVLTGEISILSYARRHHAAAALHSAILEEEMASRRRNALDLAFSSGDLAAFRNLLRDGTSERDMKLGMKALVAALPDRVAEPIRSILCSIGTRLSARRPIIGKSP